MSKDKVLQLLPQLKADELREVSAMCDYLLGGKFIDFGSPELMELFEALRTVSGRLGLPDNAHAWQTRGVRVDFLKRASVVVKFFADNFPEAREKNLLRQAMLQALLAPLIDSLRERMIPVTPRSLVLNLDKIPEFFERAFPGYLQSGLAYKTVEAMTRGAYNPADDDLGRKAK